MYLGSFRPLRAGAQVVDDREAPNRKVAPLSLARGAVAQMADASGERSQFRALGGPIVFTCAAPSAFSGNAALSARNTPKKAESGQGVWCSQPVRELASAQVARRRPALAAADCAREGCLAGAGRAKVEETCSAPISSAQNVKMTSSDHLASPLGSKKDIARSTDITRRE